MAVITETHKAANAKWQGDDLRGSGVMKIKIAAVVIVAALTQGCFEVKPKVKTWTPMMCQRIDGGGYKIQFTKQSSILSASTSGISVMNEIDGRVVNLTKESESDWACLQVGPEQEWVE